MPVLETLKISTDDFILVPGNHDARRSVVQESIVAQNKATAITTREELNDFYDANVNSPLFEDKFANFLSLQRALGNKNQTFANSIFSSYHLKAHDLSIVGFNSAWLSAGGLNGREKDRLFIPERAVVSAVSKLPNTRHTIVVTHHPLSWLYDGNAADFKRSLPAQCMHLFGHVHDPEPVQLHSPNGTMLWCQSGALYTKRKYYNGYAIISLGDDPSLGRITYFSYFEKRRRFDIATDVLPDGVFYSSETAKAYWLSQPSQVSRDSVQKWISGEVVTSLKPLLVDGLTGREVNEIFVQPSMSSEPDFGDDPDTSSGARKSIGWTEFVLSEENHVIRGRAEFGRTTILKQLAYELTSESATRQLCRAPILTSFLNLPTSIGKLSAYFRSLLPECPGGHFTFKNIAGDGYLCVLIDDVDFRDIGRMGPLSEFMKLYPKCRYVLSTIFDRVALLGRIRSAEFPISVHDIFIDEINRGRMRKIVENLHSTDPYQQELILNRIMNDLRSMNVPVTPVNGTILVFVFQNEKVFVPINKAIVLDRFVDILLKKFSIEDTFRSTFDFKNKTDLLAHIARWMCKTEVYDPDYSRVYDVVVEYLDNRGLKYSAEEIVRQLISCRVLATKANQVVFRYRSFLEFFTARAMEEDRKFRDWVLEEERYLGYRTEIEYYAGLNRSDVEPHVSPHFR